MSAVLKSETAAAPTVKLLINGEFVESRPNSGVINPATQSWARVPMCDADEIDLP